MQISARPFSITEAGTLAIYTSIPVMWTPRRYLRVTEFDRGTKSTTMTAMKILTRPVNVN
jgi:hypothetical protein